MPKSTEPISAQRGEIPLNYRRKLSLRNMAYPLQLLKHPGRNPDSPLRLATRTGPQIPCSNPRWSSSTLPAGRVLDLRRYPTAKISTPPTIRRAGFDRVYSVLYSYANARSKSLRDNDTNETPWGRQCRPAHSSWMRDTTYQLHPQNIKSMTHIAN